MQGSGTFGVEAVIASVLPPDGRLLVIVNGAYGRRIVQMARQLNIDTVETVYDEDALPDVAALDMRLAEDRTITHVAAIHCETTSGILNPVDALGAVVARHQRSFIVDAMSSFGAIPLDVQAAHIDYVISSANKCIEGLPGFSFVIARRAKLESIKPYARSLSLDLYAQWQGLERNGQFRFTPPVQVILAFHQALLELEAEGGVEGRGARYQANHDKLVAGMRKLGFRPYLSPEHQSPIITSFHEPDDANFRFDEFYARLSDRGFLIYPGKLTQAACFRIGNIGRLDVTHIAALLEAIEQTLADMNVDLR